MEQYISAAQKISVSSPQEGQDLTIIGKQMAQQQASLVSHQTLLEGLQLLHELDSQKFHIVPLNTNTCRVIDTSSHPHDLVFGFIHGITRHYHHNELLIIRSLENPHNPDAGGATYDIQW